MTKNYFKDCDSLDAIKARYRALAMKHHPDRGGDTRTMQDINKEYHELLESLDGKAKYQRPDGSWKTYKYVYKNEQQVIEVVEKLIKLNLPDDVEILIIGLYVWVRGNTKPVKDKLKTIDGMKWHSKRSCWYWRPAWMMSNYTGQPLEVLMATYGGRIVDHEHEQESDRQPSFKEIEP